MLTDESPERRRVRHTMVPNLLRVLRLNLYMLVRSGIQPKLAGLGGKNMLTPKLWALLNALAEATGNDMVDERLAAAARYEVRCVPCWCLFWCLCWCLCLCWCWR